MDGVHAKLEKNSCIKEKLSDFTLPTLIFLKPSKRKIAQIS